MTGDGIAWNGGWAHLRAGFTPTAGFKSEAGWAPLLLSLPDAHHLAADGYDVQDRNYQEQEQT